MSPKAHRPAAVDAQRLLAAGAGGVFGVQPEDAARWQALARAAGRQWFVVDTRAVATKDALLAAVGAALRFPDYFRRNWDSFEECLTDLSWLGEAGVVLMVGPVGALAASAPKDLETFIAIVRDAVEVASGTSRPLWVLVAGGTALRGAPAA